MSRVCVSCGRAAQLLHIVPSRTSVFAPNNSGNFLVLSHHFLSCSEGRLTPPCPVPETGPLTLRIICRGKVEGSSWAN